MNDRFRPCVHSNDAAANLENLSGKPVVVKKRDVKSEAFRQESDKWDAQTFKG